MTPADSFLITSLFLVLRGSLHMLTAGVYLFISLAALGSEARPPLIFDKHSATVTAPAHGSSFVMIK